MGKNKKQKGSPLPAPQNEVRTQIYGVIGVTKEDTGLVQLVCNQDYEAICMKFSEKSVLVTLQLIQSQILTLIFNFVLQFHKFTEEGNEKL